MEDKDFLSGSWEDFETWIKAKVGGEISWKIRPRDTRVNRQVVAKSIIETLERNRGRFPPSGNLFLELERNEEDP
ncbi:MAG: hypothetical protein KAJ09_00770 [Deltaproteobacteria bacterium]|nr:hypothetical protein [Deltaproteobacteria bacterium]